MELCIIPNAEFRWSVALAHVFSEVIFVLSQCTQVCRVLVSYHEWDMKEFGIEINPFERSVSLQTNRSFHWNNCATFIHVTWP